MSFSSRFRTSSSFRVKELPSSIGRDTEHEHSEAAQRCELRGARRVVQRTLEGHDDSVRPRALGGRGGCHDRGRLKGASVERHTQRRVEYDPHRALAFDEAYSQLRVICKHGADADARDENNVTSLMSSSLGGHVDAVESLLARRADINATCADGGTALMRACGRGHVRVAESLLERASPAG